MELSTSKPYQCWNALSHVTFGRAEPTKNAQGKFQKLPVRFPELCLVLICVEWKGVKISIKPGLPQKQFKVATLVRYFFRLMFESTVAGMAQRILARY